jgi:hypothetical protein
LEEEEEKPPAKVEEVPDFVLETEAGEKAAEKEPEAESAETEDWPVDAELLEEIVKGEDKENEEAEPEREQVGFIECPPIGPSYIIETDAEPLRESMLPLASLAILIDMEQHP